MQLQNPQQKGVKSSDHSPHLRMDRMPNLPISYNLSLMFSVSLAIQIENKTLEVELAKLKAKYQLCHSL